MTPAPTPTIQPTVGVLASPFSIEYTVSIPGATAEVDEFIDAAQLTCDHIEEVARGFFDLRVDVDFDSIDCTPIAGANDPLEISYEIIFNFLDATPSQAELDAIIMLAMLPPLNETLLTALGALDSSNPLSGTTSVTYSDGLIQP